MVSLEQLIERIRSQNLILLIGLTNYIKLQNLLMIQYQVIKSIFYQKDIMKPCWKRLIQQRKKMIM